MVGAGRREMGAEKAQLVGQDGFDGEGLENGKSVLA